MLLTKTIRYFTTNISKNISQSINKFESGQEIFRFLSSDKFPADSHLYNQCIKKCMELYDIDQAINILNIMKTNNIYRSQITYNSVFNGLIKSKDEQHDAIDKIFKIFLYQMTNEDNIKPNYFIAATLLRAIRIEHDETFIDKDKLKFVKKDIINKYDINLDILSLSELIRIHVKIYKLKSGYKYWKQMFCLYKQNNYHIDKLFFKPFMSATTDLVNAFASHPNSKNIDKMLKIWKLLTNQLNFYGDRIIYGCLMKGLLNNYQHNKDINNLSLLLMFYREMVNIKSIKPDHKNFHCISKCYLLLIERLLYDGKDDKNGSNNNEQIKVCLNKLMYDIPRERIKYGLKENDHILARLQFLANLLIYGHHHEKVSNLFNKLKQENKIGVSLMKQDDKTIIMDLSQCEYEIEIIFLIKSCLKEIKHYDLLIIIGNDIDDNNLNDNYYSETKMEHKNRLKNYIENIFRKQHIEIVNDNMIKINGDDIVEIYANKH